ncbi:MAG: carbon-nitrogen hydrolase family protein [Planctomyces sp.]
MKDQIRVAAVSADTRPGNMDRNVKVHEEWIRRAADQGVELISFQELSLTGFIPNHPDGNHDQWLRSALAAAWTQAQTIPGPGTDQLCRIAARHNVILAAGLLENAGNLLFNTQVLVDGNGILGQFRKMHVPMYEMPFYNGGGVPAVADTRLGRIGINICFDALLPESTRLLAVQNVEIVLFPFAADPPPGTSDAWKQWAGPAISARCIENGIFGIASNTVGAVELCGVTQTFPGGGMIAGPRGEILTTSETPSGEPGMMVRDLSASDLLSARSEPEYLFRFRRPELYGSLARPGYSS